MRNHELEREILEQAVSRAGIMPSSAEGFAKSVFARLEKGGREYGDSAFHRRGEDLLREIEEEAADVAGWSLMRATKPDDMDEDSAHMLRLYLVEAIALAIQLWQVLEGAQELEREAPRKAQPNPRPHSLCDNFEASPYKALRPDAATP